jgi:hypothetical protein
MLAAGANPVIDSLMFTIYFRNETWYNATAGDYQNDYFMNSSWIYDQYNRWGHNNSIGASYIEFGTPTNYS